MKPWLNSRGFTLIEVLLAITVLSLLMVYVFSMVDSSTTTKETIVAEDREFVQILTAFDRLEMDISQIFSPLYFTIEEITRTTPGLGIASELLQNSQDPDKRYRPTEQFPRLSHKYQPIPIVENENPTSLIFMTASNRRKALDIPESRYTWVAYNLRSPEQDDNDLFAGENTRENTQNLVRATVASNPYDDDIDWSEHREHVLLKGVKDFKFEFWNQATQRFVSLTREDPLDPLSPRLIRVSFTWVSPNGDEIDFLKSFRPLWPKFDRQAEQAQIIRVMQETARLRRQDENNPGAPPPFQDNDDDGGQF